MVLTVSATSTSALPFPTRVLPNPPFPTPPAIPPTPSVPTTTSAPTPTATWPPKLLSATATSLPESFGQTAVDKIGKVDKVVVLDANASEHEVLEDAGGDVKETLAL